MQSWSPVYTHTLKSIWRDICNSEFEKGIKKKSDADLKFKIICLVDTGSSRKLKKKTWI